MRGAPEGDHQVPHRRQDRRIKYGLPFSSLLLPLVKNNIQIQLAEKLKKVTNELRRNEKEHFLKVQEIHGDDFFNKKQGGQDKFLNDDSDLQMLEQEEHNISQHRSHEINRLVSTIKDLAVIF